MASAPALSDCKGGQIQTDPEIRDLSSLLDVVNENQFDRVLIDPEVVEKTESNFYRGAPPTWLNFYISEKAKSDGNGTTIIRRDGYEKLVQRIDSSKKGPGTSIIKLSHQQGCGGTTLAMQALWDLRKTFRCAALKGSTSNTSHVAKEVVHLFKAGSQNDHRTVLLLLNNNVILDNLQDSIMEEIVEQDIDIDRPVAILLNCIRVDQQDNDRQEHSSQVKQKRGKKGSKNIMLRRELTDEEKIKFKEKKEELNKKYGDKCKQFHGFNIMESNFSQVYIQEVCTIFNAIKGKDKSLKTQLAAFLSLLNAYAPGSYLLESQCVNFLNSRGVKDEDRSLEEQMQPFSHLIITFQEDIWSEKKVCMAHSLIAQHCTELLAKAGVTRSDTTRNFLTSFCNDDVHPFLLGFIRHMLLKRERKKVEKVDGAAKHHQGPKTGKEKQEKFSRLILDILEQEDEKMSASVLKVASDRCVQNALFPQALARLYYTEVKDYNKAEMWAKRAMERDPQKSFIADTLGQVYKNHLNKMESNATPREILQLAQKAIEAFKEEEQLAENEHEKKVKEEGQTKALREFNTRGLFGYLQVCNTLYDLLVSQNDTWRRVLTKEVSLGSVLESLGDQKLSRFIDLINSLRDEVEKKFEFFEDFFTYSDPIVKRKHAPNISKTAPECYRKYVGDSTTKHKGDSDKTLQKLKEKLSATSAGILSCLDRNCTANELRQISSWWKELSLKTDASSDALVNYILTNIMLTKKDEALSDSNYKGALKKGPVGSKDSPEYHLLALLIFWPQNDEDEPVSDISQLIRNLKHSFECKYETVFHARNLRPLFFIGKGKGLSRNVHRKVLETLWTMDVLQDPNTNWKTEKIFKDPVVQLRLLRVEGVVRNYRLYATLSGMEIELDVNRKDSLWKSGQVSFYIGFTISGPVAYSIQRGPATEGLSGKHEAHGDPQDSCVWTKLEPEVETKDEVRTYSLKSEAGHYESSVSALRWVCKEKVTLTFQFSSWEKVLKIPECMDYMPAGPLLDITVKAGNIEEVHLPHWIDYRSEMSDMFVVLHLDTCGYSVEPVSEVTSSYVKLKDPSFSPMGIMIRKKLGLPVKVFYDVLIYRTSMAFLTLHVYLVPPDGNIQQVVETNEKSLGSIIIPKPSPDTSLQLKERFLLTTDVDDADVTPEKLKLRYTKTNYFEVFIRDAEEDFSLTLKREQNSNGEEDIVWSCTIRQGDYQTLDLQQGKHFVDLKRTDLVNRVTDTVAILDRLLEKDIISQEKYDQVRAVKTHQDQMREILKVVTSAGVTTKDAFYEILKNMQGMRYLLSELEGAK